MKNWKLSIFLSFCLIFFVFAFLFKIEIITHFKRSYSFEDFEELKSEYLSAIKRIDELIKENNLLSHLIKKNITDGVTQLKDEEPTHPSLEYEKSIRRIERNLNDLWLYLRQYLNSTEIHYFNEWRYNTFSDLQVIKQRDNKRRQKSLKNLNNFMYQDPDDCKSARKLVCTLQQKCGFGV